MHKEIMFMIYKCKKFVYSSHVCIVLIGILVQNTMLKNIVYI